MREKKPNKFLFDKKTDEELKELFLAAFSQIKLKEIKTGAREKRDLEKANSAMSELLYQHYLVKHRTHKENLDLFWLAFRLREISIVERQYFGKKNKVLSHEKSLIEAAKVMGKKYSDIYIPRGDKLIGKGITLLDGYKRIFLKSFCEWSEKTGYRVYIYLSIYAYIITEARNIKNKTHHF